MAAFRITLYENPECDLSEMVGHRPPPRWVEHMLTLRGHSLDEPATSSLIEVLSEGLHRRLVEVGLVARKMEAHGWDVRIRGTEVLFTSDAPADATREALERDGVWHLVRHLAARQDGQVFL